MGARIWSGCLEMRYVCKSLTWWLSGVLVFELKLELSSHETEEFLSLATTALPPGSLTVPIPMDVQTLIEPQIRDVFGQFMPRLTALLSLLDMELEHDGLVFIALISLVSSVRNSLSTQALLPYTTIQITE